MMCLNKNQEEAIDIWEAFAKIGYEKEERRNEQKN